jgi:hypothetical protein
MGNIADERVTCNRSAELELELGNIVPGVFTPVLAKHSKSFSLIDCISVGVDRMQRNFEPKYEEFRPRTIWSLSNAFTSAFKELDPIPQFKATAKLAEFRFALDHPCGRASPAWGEKRYLNSNLAVYCQIHPKPWFDTSAASSLSVPASMGHLLSNPSP